MKKIILSAAVALFAFSAQAHISTLMTQNSFATVVECGDGDNMSVMTLKVKKVIKSDEKAEALKAELMKLNGVKDVTASTENGTVTVKYNKSELGCCSKIHSALKESKWKYEMVSNDEKPACSKDGKKMCPGHKHKGA